MAYLALYRQYRPKSFAEVIGQQHIVKTLTNAIVTGKIAHAYLFCGPRGTGKTSIARVLAKSLNCSHGPTVEPCGECPACLAIDRGSSVDVREIDAASNRGIDDIRELRQTIHYIPESRYKVYIIDEVHMLTAEAFNALLKTLEEPPANVLFVLATTEAHKVPLTILSRCQRFDFRKISAAEIVGHLRTIALANHVQASEEALQLVAERAQGGMRDALSLLDQCFAYGGEAVSRSDVLTVLGSVDDDTLVKLIQSVVEGQAIQTVDVLDGVEGSGKDLGQLTRDLLQFMRDLLTGHSSAGLVMTQDQMMSFLSILANCENEMRWSSQPRLTLELALFRASEDYRYGDRIKALEARIEAIEQHRLIDSDELAAAPTKVTKKAKEATTTIELTKPDAEKKLRPQPAKEDAVFSAASNPDAAASEDGEAAAIQTHWPQVMDWVKNEKISAHAILLHARVRGVVGDMVELNFDQEFHRRTIERPDNKQVVEKALTSVLGRPYRIKCTAGQENPTPVPKTLKTKPAQENDDLLVTGAIQVFGKDKVQIKD